MWQDLLSIPAPDPQGDVLLDVVERCYREAEAACVMATGATGRIPRPFAGRVVAQFAGDEDVEVIIAVRGIWKYYRATMEAHIVNGCYEFAGGSFVGELASPAIDTWSPEPGPGWERVAPPDDAQGIALAVFHSGNVGRCLLEHIGPTPIGGPALTDPPLPSSE